MRDDIQQDMIAMSSYKNLVAQYGTPISDADYKKLRKYADDHRIKLSGFKDFVGDIDTIKIVIDDICEIAEDFPLILDEKRGIWLELDYNLGTDFATTESGHIIHLNAGYFANIKELDQEYMFAIEEGRFVQGTDWRAISRHETGHVVADLYHINSLAIAFKILNTKSRLRVFEYLTNNLSIYSTELEDGREIISECFSAYYSGVKNNFADQFIKKVGEFI